jgi:WD40 repeat protein
VFGYIGAVATAYFIFGFAVNWWNQGDPLVSRFEVQPAWMLFGVLLNCVTARLPFLAVRRMAGSNLHNSFWGCLICGAGVALGTLPIDTYVGQLASYLDIESVGGPPPYARELKNALLNTGAFFTLAGLAGGATYWWFENSFPLGWLGRRRRFLHFIQAASVLTVTIVVIFLGPGWWRPHVAWSMFARNVDVPDFDLEHEVCGALHQMPVPAWSPDGSRLASISGEMTLRIWDLTAATQKDIPLHTIESVTPVFVANGQQVVMPVDDYGFASLDIHTGEVVHKERSPHYAGTPISHLLATPHSLAASPDGSVLAVAFGEHAIWLYRTSDWAVLRMVSTGVSNRPSVWPRNLTFSPDGRQIAFEQGRGLSILDVEDGTVVRPLDDSNALLFSDIAFNLDGTMAAVSDDERVYVLRLSDGEMIASKAVRAGIRQPAIDWDHHDTTVVFSDRQSVLHLWNPLQRGNNERTIQLRPLAGAALFSPDGTRLAAPNGSCISIFRVTRQTGSRA